METRICKASVKERARLKVYRATPEGHAKTIAAQRKWQVTHAAYRQEYRDSHKKEMSVWRKAYYAKPENKEKILAANREYKKKIGKDALAIRYRKTLYGVSSEAVNTVLDTQGFACAICRTIKEDRSGKAKTLHVDHCHQTRSFSGMLCNNCNMGLGHFKDSLGLLRNAQQYLLDSLNPRPIQKDILNEC
jgi:Recombination endonuclease VII